MFRNPGDEHPVIRVDFDGNPIPADSDDDDPLDVDESELLLNKPEIIEINRTGISEIPSPKKLHDEIKRVIHILELAQQSVPGAQTNNLHRYHYQVGLCIGAGLLAITAPSLFTSLMWGEIIRSVENVATDLVTAISQYTAAASECKSSAEIQEKALMAAASSFRGILKPVLEKWWGFSANGEDCLGFRAGDEMSELAVQESMNIPHHYEFDASYWCEKGYKYGTHGDPARCVAALQEGCHLLAQHEQEASGILHQFVDLNHRQNYCRELDDTVQSLTYNLDDIKFSDRINLTNALIAGGLTVGAAVVIGLLIYARKRSQHSLTNRNHDAEKLVSIISHSEDANTIINSCARLNIVFDPEMSISSLLQIYIALDLQIESLWQRRLAFLSGAKDPNSNLFRLFDSGGRYPSRIILQMAGLGPQTIRMPNRH